MAPRPPKWPTRTEVPAGKCPAVSAAASATPNHLAAARASTRGLARPRSRAGPRQALIATAAA
eukprot:8575546-Pyramimonas_sp.AAC.1